MSIINNHNVTVGVAGHMLIFITSSTFF